MRIPSSLPLPARISSGWRIGIVHSLCHPELTEKLTESAERVLMEAGLPKGNVRRFPAAGSFEIPLIGASLLKADEVDALIGLGVIVQGETHHAALIAQEAARAMMELQITYRRPFAFEILYVDTLEQARARMNRGEEAARAVLHSLAQIERLHS
ncbi:MAG: 6,7-dimethyl-8-ribityllumazine synthase [Candidatus Peregrinibacteria bacterium]